MLRYPQYSSKATAAWMSGWVSGQGCQRIGRKSHFALLQEVVSNLLRRYHQSMNCASSMKIQKCKTEPATRLALGEVGWKVDVMKHSHTKQQPHFSVRYREKLCHVSSPCTSLACLKYNLQHCGRERCYISPPLLKIVVSFLVGRSVESFKLDSLKLVFLVNIHTHQNTDQSLAAQQSRSKEPKENFMHIIRDTYIAPTQSTSCFSSNRNVLQYSLPQLNSRT